MFTEKMLGVCGIPRGILDDVERPTAAQRAEEHVGNRVADMLVDMANISRPETDPPPFETFRQQHRSGEGRYESEPSKAEYKIVCLDFTKIKVKLMKKLGWNTDYANQAEVWYKRFLILMVRHPGQSVVPTPAIDEMWHAHILDTQRYAKDCKEIFGKFIHHCPSYGDGDELEKTADITTELFQKAFGESPIRGGNICQGANPCCSRCRRKCCGNA